MQAYACHITEENFCAIASEKPDFNLEVLISWIADHGNGYFVRHEESPWDCAYMPEIVFDAIYTFENFEHNDLFNIIIMA